MNLAAVLILFTIVLTLLSLAGLAAWVWLAMASAEDDMRRVVDIDQLRLER
jgi:hypothetical protein